MSEPHVAWTERHVGTRDVASGGTDACSARTEGALGATDGAFCSTDGAFCSTDGAVGRPNRPVGGTEHAVGATGALVAQTDGAVGGTGASFRSTDGAIRWNDIPIVQTHVILPQSDARPAKPDAMVVPGGLDVDERLLDNGPGSAMASPRSLATPCFLMLAGCHVRADSVDMPLAAGSRVVAPCQTAADCTQPEEPCRVAACIDGGCRATPAAAGVAPQQIPGDCKVLWCDGRGGAIERADPEDKPVRTRSNCVEAKCVGDETQSTPLAAGTPCDKGEGVCNGAGICAACVPAALRCSTRWGGQPEICDASGRWQTGAACQGATRCNRGACVGNADVSLGDVTTCVRFTDGSAWCFGTNAGGVVRTAETGRRRVLTSGAEGITVGLHHACARVADGRVLCWGENTHGQLGDGTRRWRRQPVPVAGVSAALQVAAGAGHTCARLQDGGVSCWGLNNRNQLGRAASGPRDAARIEAVISGQSLVAESVSGPFVELSMGTDAGCARVAGGAVDCWGEGAVAAFEAGPPPPSRPPEGPIEAHRVARLTDAVEIAVGAMHGCARRADGSVMCWGAGESGQLGEGGSVDRAAPVRVRGLASAVALAAGRAHACAIVAGGNALCWGANGQGQLGDGTLAGHAEPQPVVGLTDLVAIVAHGDQTCARTRDGRVACWGDWRGSDPRHHNWGPRSVPVYWTW